MAGEVRGELRETKIKFKIREREKQRQSQKDGYRAEEKGQLGGGGLTGAQSRTLIGHDQGNYRPATWRRSRLLLSISLPLL